MSNIFSRIKIQNLFDQDSDKFNPNPHRAWVIIFSISILCIILVLVGNWYCYNYMHREEFLKKDDTSTPPKEIKLDRKGLTEVIGLLEARSAQFQSLLSSPSQVTDPSVGKQSSTPSTVGTSTPKNIPPKNTTNTLPAVSE
jgi:cytoskeletal protein RodZ